MKTLYQKLSRFLIGGVLAVVISVVSIVPAHAVPWDVIAGVVLNITSNLIENAISLNEYRTLMNEQWATGLNSNVSNRYIEITGDELYSIYTQFNANHIPCEIHYFKDGSSYYYGILGKGYISYPNQSVISSTGVNIDGKYLVYLWLENDNPLTPVQSRVVSKYIPTNYLIDQISNKISSIVSYVDGIEGALSSINTKLDNIFSAITGSSSVMAEARSIIEQLSVYTSTSDTTNAAKQYWSRTFVDPSSVSNMVYVTYEDLSQLVLELANIGVTTRIYYDEARQVYVIRDVGAWIVDPNTRSDYYSSSAAPEAQYHFYQHYFSLGRGQVICSTFPSLSLLLNDLNLRVVTVWNSIENGFSSLDNSISSLGDDVSAILEYLTDHEPYEPTLYVKNYYAAGTSNRAIPYASLIQMLADINVNYIDYPCYIFDVGEGFVTSCVSTSSSWVMGADGSYPILVYYREAGSDIEQLGRLCDSSGNQFRAYQMDNYPFRILESVRSILDWLENADLENNTTVNNVVNNYVDDVNISIDSFSRILDLFVTASDFGNIRADWGGAASYFNNLGKDPIIGGGDG